MKRRDFARNLALGAFGASALGNRSARAAASRAATRPDADAASGAPFKLSVMLWTVFRDLPFDERLEKVASAGFENVELVDEFRKWTETDYKNVAETRRRLGIHFDATAGIDRSLTNPAEREAFLLEVRAMLPVMERLECPALIVLSGDKVPGLSHDAQHASCVEGLKRVADLVKGRNVKVLLENIDPEENPKYFLTSVAEGLEVIREVGHPQVKFLYDFYHEQIAEGNLIEKLEKNIALIDLVHVADVPGRHEPGTGEINYLNIYRRLSELGYDRYVAMEFLPMGAPVASLEAARKMALGAGSYVC